MTNSFLEPPQTSLSPSSAPAHHLGNQKPPNLHNKPTQAISRTCSKTRFPTLCTNSFLDLPSSTTALEQDPRPHLLQNPKCGGYVECHVEGDVDEVLLRSGGGAWEVEEGVGAKGGESCLAAGSGDCLGGFVVEVRWVLIAKMMRGS
ncbi:putative pectinesterase/pectinesterase inhibitor 61 [Sesbania bispinosa]|nr:putative pectinesterase/pectinesterase inhibitor 61 [Sesbania bispinosa]